MGEKEWTPAASLREDATDEQMGLRYQFLWSQRSFSNPPPSWGVIARELATAARAAGKREAYLDAEQECIARESLGLASLFRARAVSEGGGNGT